MTRSMTGFAHRDIAQKAIKGSIDLKSYNNRYLDIYISLPPQFGSLEPRIREYLSSRIVHGKVEFTLRVREIDVPVNASADIAAAKAVAKVLKDISGACGLREEPKLSNILSFEGVVSYERELDEGELWTMLEPEVAACFASYDESRQREGAATRRDIEGQLARVVQGLAIVSSQVPEIEKTVRGQLKARFAEVMGDAVDENRILAETAALLMKYTVNEEVARLTAHIASFKRIIQDEEASAKKLDFLCQEMNREVNTIGSKNILLPVAEAVVELKDALENIREQLRNIE